MCDTICVNIQKFPGAKACFYRWLFLSGMHKAKPVVVIRMVYLCAESRGMVVRM
jgi:hypothetical protein